MDTRLEKVLQQNGIEPDSIEKKPQEAGRMKDVFRVKAGQKYGVYFYLQEDSGERNRSIQERLAAEKYIFGKIREKTSLRSPEVIDSGQNYVLCSWLNGSPLGTKDFPESKKEELAKRMGSSLAEIHEIKFDSFGEIGTDGIEEFDSWPDFVEHLISWLSSKAEKEIVQKALDYLEDNIEFMDYGSEPVLLHGDFHDGNILSGEKLGVVDCEAGFVGTREYEVYRCLSHWAEEWGVEEEFLEAYGKEKLADNWREKESYYEVLQAAMGVIDGINLGSEYLVEINEEGLRKELPSRYLSSG